MSIKVEIAIIRFRYNYIIGLDLDYKIMQWNNQGFRRNPTCYDAKVYVLKFEDNSSNNSIDNNNANNNNNIISHKSF